ncbi:hypothetical protein ED733_003348 [Metarhizium rileyi]|uniref:Uncharacterized protein n=1 Tax=Metarhizium rileyi (strain RCEF 4871) TaxID=1649241 RepID=A0A5C6G3S6_METRR|nr:hypothetical protein ED733_003348 [Metarhizium rileyi]
MGLPLFVEPVVSDLPNNASIKAGVTSPRSESRRPTRTDLRRNAMRRTGGVRVYSPAQRTLSHNARDRLLPWAESSSFRAQDPIEAAAADRRSGMFREVLREVSGSDERRRERLEERMSSLFNPTTASAPWERESMSEGVDQGWLSAADGRRLAHMRRSRVQSPHSQVNRVPDGPLLPTRRSYPHPRRDSAAVGGRDMSPFDPRMIRSSNVHHLVPSRRGTLGMDGLGDRERSLSPELWDTLLSTLTPDPQPPSARSSFTSASATHTGPSSGTPTTAPEIIREPSIDAPCESGCEHSDLEMDDPNYEHPEFRRIRRERRNAALDQANNVNRVAFATGDPRMEVARPFTPGSRTTRQIHTPNGPLTIYESSGRLGQPVEPTHPSRPASNHPQDIWAGEISVEVSGQRGDGHDEPGQNQEEVASPTHVNPMASEDDWAGMQRIVRSLARREDIPDEWWADAGLSRTIRQEQTSTTVSGALRQNVQSINID